MQLVQQTQMTFRTSGAVCIPPDVPCRSALGAELTIIGNRGVCGAVLIRDRLTATPLMTFVAHKRRETARQPRPEVLLMAMSVRPLSLRGSTRFLSPSAAHCNQHFIRCRVSAPARPLERVGQAASGPLQGLLERNWRELENLEGLGQNK